MSSYHLPSSATSPRELLQLIGELPPHPRGEPGLDPLSLASDAAAMRLLGEAVDDNAIQGATESASGSARAPTSPARVTVLASSASELHRSLHNQLQSTVGRTPHVAVSEAIDLALVRDSLSDDLFLIGLGTGPSSTTALSQDPLHSSSSVELSTMASRTSFAASSPSQQRRQRKPTFASNTAASSPQPHGSSTSSRFAASRSQLFRGNEAEKEARFCVPLRHCRALSILQNSNGESSWSRREDTEQRFALLGLSWFQGGGSSARSGQGAPKATLSGLQPWLLTGVASFFVSVLVSAPPFRNDVWCLEEKEVADRITRRGILLYAYKGLSGTHQSNGAGTMDTATLTAESKTDLLYDYHATVVEVLGQHLVTLPAAVPSMAVPPPLSPTSPSSSSVSVAGSSEPPRGGLFRAIQFLTMHLLAPYSQAHNAGALNVRLICSGLSLTANWSEDPEVQRGMARWERSASSAADAAAFRSCGPFFAVLVQEVGLLLVHESLVSQEGGSEPGMEQGGNDHATAVRALSQRLLDVTTPCDFSSGVFLLSPHILLRALLPPPNLSLAPPEDTERSPSRGPSFRTPASPPSATNSSPNMLALPPTPQLEQQLRELILELGNPFDSILSPFSTVIASTTLAGQPGRTGQLPSKTSSFKAASGSSSPRVPPRPSTANLNLDGPPQCLRSRIHLTFPSSAWGSSENYRNLQGRTEGGTASIRSQFLDHLQFISQVHGSCLAIDLVPIPNVAESIWLQAGLLTADPFMCDYLEWNPQSLLGVGSSYLTCSQAAVAALADRPACVVLQTLLEDDVEQLVQLLLSVVSHRRDSGASTGEDGAGPSTAQEVDLARACVILTSATESHADPQEGKGFKVGHLSPTPDGLVRLARLTLQRPCYQMRQYWLSSNCSGIEQKTGSPGTQAINLPKSMIDGGKGTPLGEDASIPLPLLSLQRLVASMMEPSTFEAQVLHGYLFPELANTVYAAYELTLGLGLQRRSLASPRLFPSGTSSTSGDALIKSGSTQRDRRTSIKERNRSLSTSQGFPNLARSIQDLSNTSEAQGSTENGRTDGAKLDDGEASSEDLDDEAEEILEMLSVRLQSSIDKLDFGPRLRWVMSEAKDASVGILHQYHPSSSCRATNNHQGSSAPQQTGNEFLSSPEVQRLFPEPFVVQRVAANVVVPILSQLIQKRLDHAKNDMVHGPLPSGKAKAPETPVVVPSIHEAEVRRLVQERLHAAFVDSFHWTFVNTNLSTRRDSTNALVGTSGASVPLTTDPLESPLLPPRLVVSKLSLLAIPTWIRIARLIDRHSTSLLQHFLQQPSLERSNTRCTQWLLSLFPTAPSVQWSDTNPSNKGTTSDRSLCLSYGRLRNPTIAPREICFGVSQAIQTELSITKDSEPAAHNLLKLATATATLNKVVAEVAQKGLEQPYRPQTATTQGSSTPNASPRGEEVAKSTTSSKAPQHPDPSAAAEQSDGKLRALEEENRRLRLQLEEATGVSQQKLASVQRAESRLVLNLKFLMEKEQHIFFREEALFREQLGMEERNERLGRFLLAMHGFGPAQGKGKEKSN
jgi:hypothetical protein